MYNFVNDKYKIDFDMPSELNYIISLIEDADQNNHYGDYLSYADAMDTIAKNCCADGVITEVQWNLLLRRYLL